MHIDPLRTHLLDTEAIERVEKLPTFGSGAAPFKVKL
jgi:hypothetical protein